METKSYRHGSNALTAIDLRPENLYKGLIVQGDEVLLEGSAVNTLHGGRH